VCNDLSVSQSDAASSFLPDETDDESRLLDMVRSSGRTVALYDVATPALLAVSERARKQLGFVDVELDSVDIVERSANPDGVRKLLALIREGHLRAWKFHSWTRNAEGGPRWNCATGHAIDVGGRRLGLVTYDAPATPEDPRDLIDGSAQSAEEGRLLNRVLELEDRLRRISREVQAAGIGRRPRNGLSSEAPGLERLSRREVEIVTRMIAGERVPTIARELHLSASTVRNHLSRAYQKFGVHSQVQLIDALRHRDDERRAD